LPVLRLKPSIFVHEANAVEHSLNGVLLCLRLNKGTRAHWEKCAITRYGPHPAYAG